MAPVPVTECKLYLIGWQLGSVLIVMETRCIQSLGEIYETVIAVSVKSHA